MPGGVDVAEDGSPIFYVATVEQMSLRRPDGTTVAPIDSHTKSTSIEINDTVVWNAVAVDVGVLFSQDVLYGQGLRAATGTVSGFALAPGHRYRMVSIRWQDMVQPRLGATWSYNGTDTVFANYARYNPEASSLARAASWDRNTRASLRVLFDEAGRVISSEPHPRSSGKGVPGRFEAEAHRRVDARHNARATRRAHPPRSPASTRGIALLGGHLERIPGLRQRTPHIAAQGPYVPGLDAIRAEIGGSSYVIAALDDAYTRYWEAAVELEWRGARGYLNASYVHSRYTGNFDQDNTSTNNDANLFIASSNLAGNCGIGRTACFAATGPTS
ncbi:MAG: hypothetical protein OXH09_24575 [Gammaproteobacteria bacterium]|nr:hypothetical protein [Gammaproteobacteria bacterium]